MSHEDQKDTQPIPVMRPGEGSARRRPHASSLILEAAGLSHAGRVRSDNQDHFLVARVGRSLDTLATSLPDGEIPIRFDETGYVLLVADGMGGAAGGEVASRMAISTLVNMVLDVPSWIVNADEDDADQVMQRAAAYYRRVDRALADMAESRPELDGMGTTMTAAYGVGRELFVAHAGDSRAYLMRKGRLEQLTRDHTHVQQMVDAGTLSREEAAEHRLRHVLTNVLGGRAGLVGVDIERIPLADGDRLLLCTDGLTETVKSEEIAAKLDHAGDPAAVCRALVDLALERGGPDNVTVVVGRIALPPDPPDDRAAKPAQELRG